jgi:DOPA 4,5-dioxygenase
MTIKLLGEIQSYHAHVYFDGPEQSVLVDTLRDQIAERFSVLLGRRHDRPIGPHARPMFQVAFDIGEFDRMVPWLMLNRQGLTVLVHPNTGHPRRDHLHDALWLGEVLTINPDPFLVEREAEPEAVAVPNTQPKVLP